jgi:hypothetical protein
MGKPIDDNLVFAKVQGCAAPVYFTDSSPILPAQKLIVAKAFCRCGLCLGELASVRHYLG